MEKIEREAKRSEEKRWRTLSATSQTQLEDYSSYLMADQTSAKESALLSLKMKYNKINIDSISRLKLTWE